MKNFSNVHFPKKVRYVRHPDRIYTIFDPKDGEILTYQCTTGYPSSNANGNRYYMRDNGQSVLVNWDDIKEIIL